MRGTLLKTLTKALPLLLLVLTQPLTAHACAVCYGDPDAPVSKGLSWAIFALAGLVMGVVGGLVAFFVFASRRAARLDADASTDTGAEHADPVLAAQH